MNIGLDAKRIFYNGTGLGVYGRNLLHGLESIDNQNKYYLFTPKVKQDYISQSQLKNNFHIINAKKTPSYIWRTLSITKDIEQQNIDIYHGLSNELPFNINKTKCKSIVDIHDMCFVKFKEGYNYLDQKIYWHKTKRAANQSDKIIATSFAVKKDILELIDVPEHKIEVVYQCCDASFYKTIENEKLASVKSKFSLPDNYVLSVGTIQKRKNQKAIIEAMALLPKSKQVPIVLVGNGGTYLTELIQLAKTKSVELLVLNNVSFADLPAVYQNAKLFVYPSFIEGFGIPVLEAMASKVPTITSENTSMAEIILKENPLINPHNIGELSEKIDYYLNNNMESEITENFERAKMFSQEKFASDVLKIYKTL